MLTIVVPEISNQAAATIAGGIITAATIMIKAYIAYRRDRDEKNAAKEASHNGLVNKVVELVEKVAGTVATGTEVMRQVVTESRATVDRLGDMEVAILKFPVVK